jgi:hypothetical protein
MGSLEFAMGRLRSLKFAMAKLKSGFPRLRGFSLSHGSGFASHGSSLKPGSGFEASRLQARGFEASKPSRPQKASEASGGLRPGLSRPRGLEASNEASRGLEASNPGLEASGRPRGLEASTRPRGLRPQIEASGLKTRPHEA